MARQQTSDFLKIIEAAVAGAMARVSGRLAAEARALARRKARTRAVAARGRRGGRARRRARPAEISAWTTNLRARRVPNFVIAMTGLDTKKKLVARFGHGVTFRRGHPLPPVRQAPPPAVARPPRIRKASAAKPASPPVAAKPVVAKPPRIRKAGALERRAVGYRSSLTKSGQIFE